MFTTINKQDIQLLSSMLAGTDVSVCVVSCGGNPDYPEETHLPDLVLTYHLTCDTNWFDLYNEIDLFVPQTHHNSYIDKQ